MELHIRREKLINFITIMLFHYVVYVTTDTTPHVHGLLIFIYLGLPVISALGQLQIIIENYDKIK